MSVIVNSYDALIEFFTQDDRSSGMVPVALKVEAAGLLAAINEHHFIFTAMYVKKILALLDPANIALQNRNIDLYSGVTLVKSALTCVEKLKSDIEFQAIWAQATATHARANGAQDAQSAADAQPQASETPPPPPQKRVRKAPKHLQEYVVESTVVGQRDQEEQQDRGSEVECKRVFISTIENVTEEMKSRFSEMNSQLVEAMCALDPASKHFLDVQMVKPLLELTSTALVESEFDVACEFIQSQMASASSSKEDKWTTGAILQRYAEALKAMPSVLTAMKHAITFGASTATCENSFSTLTNVFSQHRRSMLHPRKANLIQLAIERDLTIKFQADEWKERLLRKFNKDSRRLQLY